MASTLHQKPAAGSERSGQALSTEVTDLRATPRYRVQFRSVVSSSGRVREGMGTVLDLSLRGLSGGSPFRCATSLVMELRIYVPSLDWPLMVDGAVVQSVDGATFDLRFLRLREIEKQRLAEVIATAGDEQEE